MNKDLGVWTSDDCALVLIDYQNEMFEVIRSETNADLVELNVRLLAKTAKAFDMPIVLSTVGVGYGFNGPTLPVGPVRARRDRADRPVVDERVRGPGFQRRGEGDRAQAADHRRAPHRDLPHLRDRPGAEGRLRRDVRHRRRRRAVTSRPPHRHRTPGARRRGPDHRARGRHRAVPGLGRHRWPGRPSTSSTGTSTRSRSSPTRWAWPRRRSARPPAAGATLRWRAGWPARSASSPAPAGAWDAPRPRLSPERARSVVGCDVTVEPAEETVALVQAAGGQMVSLQPCRLSDPSECDSAR